MTKDFDKVYEVYMDSRESALTLKTRERIGWICGQVTGKSVLDVGCSQGITAILLGREQKTVLAVDIVEASIHFAKQKLREEEVDVQQRITFAVGDFLDFDFGGQKFDTIIMTEVLEHVPDVEPFLKKAASCAGKNTRFIITVPFGINDYWDHKRTYYFASLYEQLEENFEMIHVEFMGGKWMGVTAVLQEPRNARGGVGCGIVPDKELMLREEEKFFEIERQLMDEKAAYRKRICDQREKNDKLWEHNEKLREQNVKMNDTVQKLQDTIAQNAADINTDQKKDITTKADEIERLKRRVAVLDRRWRTASTRLETMKRNYADINERYDQLAKSALGRIQIFIYRVKSFCLRKASAAYVKIRKTNDYVETPSASESDEADRVTEIRAEEETEQTGFLQMFLKDTMIEGEVYQYSWPDLYMELRAEVCDENYLEKMKPYIDKLPVSSGSRYYTKLPYKIGMIADEFLYHTYENVADCSYITPDYYKLDIDILFVASTWHGLNNEWHGISHKNNLDIRNKLTEVITYHRDRGAKIVFYSKEDPGNYYVFLYIARQCDYIFTTAQECVEQYKKDTNVKNIHVLEFAINPIYHNPVGSRKYVFDEVMFAGTWWNKKYPMRKTDMEEVFQTVLHAGKSIKIIDRNYSVKKPDYFYPAKYLKYVSPEMDHEVLQKLQRLYPYSININTCKQSSTMYASRVYEIQALGKVVVSNHSLGMERKFPNIIIGDANRKAVQRIQSLKDDDLYELQMEGLRRVMTNETVYDRINTILEIVGKPKADWDRKIGIIVDNGCLDGLTHFLEEQTYKNCLIIEKLDRDIYAKVDMVTFWNEKYHYGKVYLEDMINGFKYTDCDFITKDAYYKDNRLIEGIEHDYIDHVPDIYRTVFWTKNMNYRFVADRDFSQITNGYSIDHLNLVICA